MSLDEFIKYEEWDEFWCFKPKEDLELETLNAFNGNSWKPQRNGVKIIIESNEESKEPTANQIFH